MSHWLQECLAVRIRDFTGLVGYHKRPEVGLDRSESYGLFVTEAIIDFPSLHFVGYVVLLLTDADGLAT